MNTNEFRQRLPRGPLIRYDAAVAAERRAGAAFVRQEADRIRKELGLPCV